MISKESSAQSWSLGPRQVLRTCAHATSNPEVQCATQVRVALSAGLWWRPLRGEAVKRIPGEDFAALRNEFGMWSQSDVIARLDLARPGFAIYLLVV